jgi:predicted phosphodiesterase
LRIGFVSDIHGNAPALEAAIEALRGVDMLCCLGDAISEHRFSNEVVGLLRANHAITVQGNHEAMFFSEQGRGARRAPWIDQELLAWLAARPCEHEINLGGKTLRLVHATSWSSAWDYVFPGSPDFGRFAECGAHFVAYGHTHQPLARRVGATLVLNPGSVGEGRPTESGFQPSCAILDIDREEATIIDLEVADRR